VKKIEGSTMRTCPPASLQNVLATSAYVLFYEITRQSRDELLARYFSFHPTLC